MEGNARIKTLEGLRAVAFLGVVFCHTNLAQGYFNLVGHWGVSVFFVLSGFVALYSQIDKKDFTPSISYNFSYLIKRMKKLYPLHILTTLAYIPFEFIGESKSPLSTVLIRLGLNVAFLQEWLPLNKRSYNGVSWFLCTSALFYFIFPYLLKHIQKGYSVKKALRAIAVCILIEVAIAAVSILFLPRPVYSIDMFWTYNTVLWFVYYFPLSRIFDCLIGCNLAYIFLCNKDRKISSSTAKESGALIISIISTVIASMLTPITPIEAEVPAVNYTIGWSYALLFLPSAISMVYLFAYGQGKISQFFTHNIFMYAAKISPYGFLIHYVVFNYLKNVIYLIIGDKKAYQIFRIQYLGWIILTLGVLLSLIATQIWMYLMEKIKAHQSRKSSFIKNKNH